MDGERLGINNMGKDIDRNITRQLWERLKNTFSRNDVIPVKNGGTGETSSYDTVQSLTITISIKPSSAITDIYSNNYKGFISFPV